MLDKPPPLWHNTYRSRNTNGDTKMATKKQPKQVQIIARYIHKTDGKPNGKVSYLVRSSDGKTEYCTTLIDGKASGCSCPSHKPCYHMSQLEAKEQERKEVASKLAAKS